MSRFAHTFRSSFPNTVARHFDKYVGYIHPLDFDPLEDVYRPAFTPREYDALNTLLERPIGCQTLDSSSDFRLVMPGDKSREVRRKTCLNFGFPDKRMRPSLEIEFDSLPERSQNKIKGWVVKAISFRILQRELRNRVAKILDWGWRRGQSFDTRRCCWRGGPTPGQGCNTVGQIDRVWPELTVFFPAEEIAKVRNAQSKSRLPKYISCYGTPKQFRCEAPWFHDATETGEGTQKYSAFEMEVERRKFAAINHILTQISLMKDVPHVDYYPEIYLGY